MVQWDAAAFLLNDKGIGNLPRHFKPFIRVRVQIRPED